MLVYEGWLTFYSGNALPDKTSGGNIGNDTVTTQHRCFSWSFTVPVRQTTPNKHSPLGCKSAAPWGQCLAPHILQSLAQSGAPLLHWVEVGWSAGKHSRKLYGPAEEWQMDGGLVTQLRRKGMKANEIAHFGAPKAQSRWIPWSNQPVTHSLSHTNPLQLFSVL